MIKESLLYFAEDTTTSDSGGLFSASSFLGMEVASASTCKLTFKAATNVAGVATVVVSFSGTFKDACKTIAGALNSNTMTVVADEANGVYLLPFFGTVTVDNVV
tara:strand:+ start:69 stop:380 length:312 start_codon:yes stop_codon:yes gene_type:complete